MNQISFSFSFEPEPEVNLSDQMTPSPEPVAAVVSLTKPAEEASDQSTPSAQPPVKTLADALIAIDGWVDLSKSRRDVMKSHVRTCGLAIASSQSRARGQLRKLSRNEVQLAAMPFDVPWLNQYLHTHSAKVIGLKSDESLINAKSGLKSVAYRLGLLEKFHAPEMPANNVWEPLLAAADHIYKRPGIARFAGWCIENHIIPTEVNADTFSAYETFVRLRLLHKNIPKLLRSIKDHWKTTASKVDGWPELAIPPASQSRHYTPPLSDYPASFQEEVAAFGRQMAGTERRGPFRRLGDKRPLRPVSVNYRLNCIRMAAAALVLSGRGIHSIKGLADLVTPEAAEIILKFHWDRTVQARLATGKLAPEQSNEPGAGNSSQTEGLGGTLVILAQRYCHTPPDVVALLKELAADVRRPPISGLTPKNRERLRQFDDPRARADLLALPRKLMKLAMDPDAKPAVAARMARQAVLIGLLCRIPLRAKNLRMMRMDHNLKFADGSARRANRLEYQAAETKNSNHLEFAIGPSIANLLEIYIRKFLPFFADASPDFAEHRWLFPSGGGRPGPISGTTLTVNIRDPIAEHVGADVNPNLFRSFMARMRLEHSPGAIEDVRLLLGDKTMTVVLRHYVAFEPVTASRRYDELIEREDKRLTPFASRPARRTK